MWLCGVVWCGLVAWCGGCYEMEGGGGGRVEWVVVHGDGKIG